LQVYFLLYVDRIGKTVFFDGAHQDASYYVTIKDDVMLNCKGAALQSPHSLEIDQTVSMKHVTVGKGAGVMFNSNMNGSSNLPARAVLGSRSRPFQGQLLEEGEEYNSSPAVKFAEAASAGSVPGNVLPSCSRSSPSTCTQFSKPWRCELID